MREANVGRARARPVLAEYSRSVLQVSPGSSRTSLHGRRASKVLMIVDVFVRTVLQTATWRLPDR